jgi:hypothetical protein
VSEFCFDKNLAKINEHLSVLKNKVLFLDLCAKRDLTEQTAFSGQYLGQTHQILPLAACK